jgi:hypothetical protein
VSSLRKWNLTGVAAALVVAAIAPLRIALAADAQAGTEGVEFFESKIRPVLVDKCYQCHSEQSKKLKGDLKLDSPAGLLRGGESGMPSVVPGHPEKSKLVEAIAYKNDDLQMPPKEKLPAEVVANFESWVRMGAPDPRTTAGIVSTGKTSHLNIAAAKSEWWSFKPPVAHAPPVVKDTGWVKSPIDAFVLAKLEEKGLRPNVEADKRTLIRRATFDLIGLPPTPEEIADFEADASPSAFETVVDRLLASPHYGERWGRHWLDVCRYADSKGYVFQEERRYPFAYTFRDWVVRAFNEDLPYDQFIIDQLAADRLNPGEDKSALAAMGFLTVGRRFLNNQADIIDDRLDVMGRGLLGLTIGCARCHDHKFDPIPTADYYSLYGVFASSTEPADLPEITSAKDNPQRADYENQRKKLEAELEQFRAARLGEITANLRTAKSIADAMMAARELANGGPKDDAAMRAIAQKYGVRRLAMARWKAYLDRVGKPSDPIFAAWAMLSAVPEAEIPAKLQDAAKACTNPLVAAVLTEKPPKSLRDVADRYGEVIAKHAKPEKLSDASEEALRQVTYAETGPTSVTLAEVDQLLNNDERNKLRGLRQKVDQLAATHPGVPAKAMVLVDLPQPVQPHVFKRGNPGMPGDTVPRAFLSVLSPRQRPAFNEGSGRLELAKDIASKDNPLTARVMVNRVWAHHFGFGLVRTPSDFGRRGEPPTHPELLDDLAAHFVQDGWSVKRLHKRMMLSAVYQQSSDDANAAARAADPENRLLWKMNRQRLDFEAMRDSLLAVSGSLDPAVGGRAVDLLAQPFTHRRTLYGFIDRQNLPNVFRAFDFASPDQHTPQRYLTTVPQQALFLMNSPFVIESAKLLAKRPDLVAVDDTSKRIERMYALALGRKPTAEELKLGRAFLESETASRATMLNPWEKYAQVLLETNEFVFVD